MGETDEGKGFGAPPAVAPEKVQRAKAEAIGVSVTAQEGNELELSGTLIEAIQHLVNRVVNPRAEGRKWVNLDVGGFREEGDPAVKAMADRLAAAAQRMGKVLAIAPISARERRMIHLSLVDSPDVTTRSEGEGIFRQLLILPGGKKA
jgi:spoIIIJ-associated protein